MKNIIYLIEFIFIKILFLIFSLIGYKNSSNFGSLIGKLIGPFFRSKSLIIKNLRQAQISNKDNLEKISTNVLSNYGRIFSEYVYLKDFRNDKLKKYISIEGTEYLDEIKKKK